MRTETLFYLILCYICHVTRIRVRCR